MKYDYIDLLETQNLVIYNPNYLQKCYLQPYGYEYIQCCFLEPLSNSSDTVDLVQSKLSKRVWFTDYDLINLINFDRRISPLIFSEISNLERFLVNSISQVITENTNLVWDQPVNIQEFKEELLKLFAKQKVELLDEIISDDRSPTNLRTVWKYIFSLTLGELIRLIKCLNYEYKEAILKIWGFLDIDSETVNMFLNLIHGVRLLRNKICHNEPIWCFNINIKVSKKIVHAYNKFLNNPCLSFDFPDEIVNLYNKNVSSVKTMTIVNVIFLLSTPINSRRSKIHKLILGHLWQCFEYKEYFVLINKKQEEFWNYQNKVDGKLHTSKYYYKKITNIFLEQNEKSYKSFYECL